LKQNGETAAIVFNCFSCPSTGDTTTPSTMMTTSNSVGGSGGILQNCFI